MKNRFLPFFVILLSGCTSIPKDPMHTFQSDLEFLKKYAIPIVLSSDDKQQQIIVDPGYQGRVMTSTATGPNGRSHGWINDRFIALQKTNPNINPYGGSDRLWIGPLGSQYSLYYQGKEFDDKYWHVPKDFDRVPFRLIETGADFVLMKSDMNFSNFIGTQFSILIKRRINLLSSDKVISYLNCKLPKQLNFVGFESINTLTNTGEDWSDEQGTLALWSLGQFLGNDQTVIIAPFQEHVSGKKVNTYLADIPQKRLHLTDKAILFLGDGRFRSKIGTPPTVTLPVFGALDLKNKILTIIQFQFENEEHYFNSDLGHQERPFEGDVISIYNNDPEIHDGKSKNSFYELESASSMKALKKHENMTHFHRTIIIEGHRKSLFQLTNTLLGVNEKEIEEFLSAH